MTWIKCPTPLNTTGLPFGSLTPEAIRERGIAFGYPKCCIEWFIRIWDPFCESCEEAGNIELLLRISKALHDPDQPRPEYIQCPTCSKKKSV